MYIDKLGSDMVEDALFASIEGNLEKAHIPPRGRTAFQKAAALYKHCSEANTNTSVEDARDFLRAHRMDITKKMLFDALDVMVKFIFKIDIPLLFSLEPAEIGARTFALRVEKRAPTALRFSGAGDILADVYSVRIDDNVVQIITRLEKEFEPQRAASQMSNASVKAVVLRNVGLGDDELSKDWNEALRRYAPPELLTKAIHMTEVDLTFFHRLFGKQGDVSKDEMRVFFAWRAALYFYGVIFLRPSFLCLRTIMQELPAAVAAGAPLLNGYEERISAVNEMQEELRSELSKTLRTSPWMDDETRKGALQKVSMIRFRFGLAPNLNTSEKADRFYEDLPDLNGPFVRDMLSVNEFKTQRLWKGVREGYSDYFYDTITLGNPYEANGFYVAAANFLQLNVPILLPPHFTLGGPPEMNYGELGSKLMHEMMHGFDPYGRKHDGKGNISPWFTKKSAEELAVLERCYVEKIDRAPKARKYADRPAEYQADIFGIRSLLRAYLKVAERSNVHLGNVKGLTRDQIFYVATCLLWCTDLVLKESPSGHPPGDERCNLPLMNSAHFSKTFSCREDSPMNPPNKCLFW
ncbi:neprilysin-1-like [Ornithodoros turicata]|uniref:neprilysin-1-like n=1 Tax=Ornithodoros turicata TaxID=34597 RepID=UPI003139F3FB